MPQPKRRPHHKGRSLELLVARIKEHQLPDATVRSPDFVPDRDTGQRREVDVGIHVTRDGGSTFIAIECRNRKAVQHVEWVEQLICKKQSIGADVLIAVTSSRFYRPARVKALKHGVILARMTSKLPAEIVELAESFFITFLFVAPRIMAVDLQLPSHLTADLEGYRYRHLLVSQDLTLSELAQMWSTPNLIRTVVKDVKDFSSARFAKVMLSKIDANVLTMTEELPIEGAKITFELNFGEVQLPLRAVHELSMLEAPSSDDVLNFVFGTRAEAMSEIVVDLNSDTLRWDILGNHLLGEGKVLIGARLKASKPVSITTMRLDL
jgi:restriction endonuclease